jgi:hypothetical protein
MATKKGKAKNNFFNLIFLLMLDPGWEKIRVHDNHSGSETLIIKKKAFSKVKMLKIIYV